MSLVLIVDDGRGLARCATELAATDPRIEVVVAADADHADQLLAERPWDVVVSDLHGSDGASVDVLDAARRACPAATRVVVGETDDAANLAWVASMAHQFLRRPFGAPDLAAAVARAVLVGERLGPGQLRAQLSNLDALPSPSPVLGELLASLDDPDAGPARVASVAARDVGVAARLLQLANSPFFAVRRQITDLADAVALLGTGVVRSLVIEAQMLQAFNVAGLLPAEWLAHLGRHGLDAALLARRLVPRDVPWRDHVFCAALLAEAGQIALAALRPELVTLRVEGWHGDASLADSERATFGFTHAEIGGALLALWGLPAEIVEAVAGHDTPVSTSTGEPAPAEIVHVATRLAERTGGVVCGPEEAEPLDQLVTERGWAPLVAEWLEAAPA